MFAQSEHGVVKTVNYTAAAEKALTMIDARMVLQIRAKVDLYAAKPEAVAGSVKRLRGSPFIRLRVADYRVVIDEKKLTVVVIKIGHRSDVYR